MPREVKMHYHVIGGQHGCMPNYNAVFTELGAAEEDFRRMVEEEFDLLNLPDWKVHYTPELDYAEIQDGGNEYYEINTCDEPSCITGD
jgi:hypothetical protein